MLIPLDFEPPFPWLYMVKSMEDNYGAQRQKSDKELLNKARTVKEYILCKKT